MIPIRKVRDSERYNYIMYNYKVVAIFFIIWLYYSSLIESSPSHPSTADIRSMSSIGQLNVACTVGDFAYFA